MVLFNIIKYYCLSNTTNNIVDEKIYNVLRLYKNLKHYKYIFMTTVLSSTYNTQSIFLSTFRNLLLIEMRCL